MTDAEILELAEKMWSPKSGFTPGFAKDLLDFAREIANATKEEDAVKVKKLAKDFNKRGLEGACLIFDCAAAIRGSKT